MNLIYSCVFFQESYINLIELLLKSYILYGNADNNIKYMIICDLNFKEKINHIFKSLNINGDIWCLDLKTKFEAGYSRLHIFDYPEINNYEKILYLDCDILFTNDISNIFDINIDEKMYVLEEGNTNHKFWGSMFFENNPNQPAFTSGILLFRNCYKMKKLFEDILNHIKNHINENKEIPICLDQPFIIYHAFKNNIYDNQILKNKVVNNPIEFKGESICHFPGGPGHYESKIDKMKKFMNNIMMNKINYELVLFEDYKKLLEDNKFIFYKLKEICIEIGEPVEGNCFTEHLNINNDINELKYKQMNHVSLGKKAKNILEIGFNAGHSSLLYLLSNPSSKITAFDLCEHKYTKLCFEYLNKLFPGRLRLFAGDSTKTIPEFINNNITNEKFDLIHIDGCHETEIANKDFYNCFELASDIIIWDDTQIKPLNDLFELYKKRGYITEIFYNKTFVYKHRICKIDILKSKSYNWHNSYIKFISNNKMEAFGDGLYCFINNNLIYGYFGGREHFIKFDKDFKNYISIRKGDFEVICGKLIE